jgi:voltage-gated potassium channel Kch
MLARLLFAFGLMALCVAIHAAGLGGALRWLEGSTTPARTFWRWTGLLVGLAGWTIFVHLIEITLWALFYTWKKGMPDLQSALYFSSVTYTTTGYGDLVLPKEWRLVGGVEALTGILMCGWSTGFFFAIVSRIHLTMKQTAAGPPP